MATPFLAEIVMFGSNFAPRSWAFCDGQLLPISSNTALFSLLGTIYGGDGRTTFQLPDLRGRVPMGPRTGAGLTPRTLGQRGGVEDVTLNTNQIPSHNHSASSQANAVAGVGNSNDAANNFWSKDAGVSSATYNTGPSDATMNTGAVSTTIGNTGGNQSHTNVQPFLCVNFIIALQGVFPSRN